MASWGRVVAGVVIGVAGTIYATNEDVRKRLPKAARDLPDNIRRRYNQAISAGREASAQRRQEILHDLEDMDCAQTAQVMGVSVGAAKVRIHRARARLKAALEQHCGFYHDSDSVLRCEPRR